MDEYNRKDKRRKRRQNQERMKDKARKLYPHDKKAKNANHLATCSCRSCGNQRLYEGPTKDELIYTIEDFE